MCHNELPILSKALPFCPKIHLSKQPLVADAQAQQSCPGAGQNSSMGPAQNTPAWLHRALGQRNTWLHLPEGCLLMLTVPIQLQSRIISPPAPERFLCPDFLRHFPDNHSAHASSGTGLGLLSISAHSSFLSEQFCKLKPLPQVSKGRFLGSKQPEECKK